MSPTIPLRVLALSALAAPWYALGWALRIRRPDPWRRTVGLGLRGEGSKFALCAFGLALFPDGAGPSEVGIGQVESVAARRVQETLQEDPGERWMLSFGRALVSRRRSSAADVCLLRFDDGGALEGLDASFDPRVGGDSWTPGERAKVGGAIVAAHRATSALPEWDRPGALQARMRAELAAIPGVDALRLRRLGDRLLASTTLTVEWRERNDAERFGPPPFAARRGLGFGGMHLVARWIADRRALDLWANLHHAAFDGAPVQEWLSRLERRWGLADVPAFPADGGHDASRGFRCSAGPAERDLHLIADFIDLTPLHRWGREEGAPVVAALIWWLAREPEFAGRRFGVAVEVPASNGFARAVDLIGIRPADFSTPAAPADGFAEFARAFAQKAELARARRGPTFAAMRNAALLPAGLASTWIRAKGELAAATFGTIGVTMLRDAKVFVAPMADFGWPDGFLALGSTALPAEGGGSVTSVTVKGEAPAIAAYPAAIRRAVARCAESKAQ